LNIDSLIYISFPTFLLINSNILFALTTPSVVDIYHV